MRAADPGQAKLGKLGEALIARGVSARAIDDAIEAQQEGDPRHLGEILVERGVIRPDEVREALCRQRESEAGSSVRVAVGLLEDLTNTAAELVRAGSRITRLCASSPDPGLQAASLELDRITTKLREQLAETRMQPIASVSNRLPRIVRDLARDRGKRVRIEMRGQDTEIDATILEAIEIPLTHLVCNSVDHGIEDPESRAAAGKPEEGVVALRAYREGGRVYIEIADDGAGIDVERLREKALELNLISADQSRGWGERDLLPLIFAPRLSTARAVTSVSGRGFGMDVVKTNVEGIGGTIELQSTRGVGVRIRLELPLAMTPSVPSSCPRTERPAADAARRCSGRRTDDSRTSGAWG